VHLFYIPSHPPWMLAKLDDQTNTHGCLFFLPFFFFFQVTIYFTHLMGDNCEWHVRIFRSNFPAKLIMKSLMEYNLLPCLAQFLPSYQQIPSVGNFTFTRLRNCQTWHYQSQKLAFQLIMRIHSHFYKGDVVLFILFLVSLVKL